jgi:hypothetical protein
LCGGSNIEWSEFESHIWCYDCNKDVLIPSAYAGVFGGPIPWEISKLLGLCFSRINLESKRIFEPDFNTEVNYEKKVCRDRELKLNMILNPDDTFDGTWVYDAELEKYKMEINKKIYI